MKAVVVSKYGPPEGLEIREIDTPSPDVNEVLIRIHASSVTFGDAMMRRMKFPIGTIMRLAFRMDKENAVGHEFAGEIESVGEDVTLFKKGNQVFGTTGMRGGANAEYICLSEDAVFVAKPANLSFEEAAVVPVGAITALYILKQGNIQSGQKVLVYGASGSVGTYAVQLAKYWGATVTGVCSTKNMEMVQSIGADRVLDYTAEDVTQTGDTYDVIFDAVRKLSKSKCKGILKENGIFLSSMGSTKESVKNLNFLKELIEDGELKPVVDKIFTLDEIVEAHRYVDTGRKKGNLVIKVR